MYPSPRSHALPSCFLILLAACGGGGGGGGPVDIAFQSFSTIGPNQRALMFGISQTASGSGTPVVGGVLIDPNTVTLGPTDSTVNTSARITFDGNRNISAFSFTAPQSSASFGSGVDCSAGAACVADTANSLGVLGNPSFASHNWNYQTFGVWLVLPSPSTFQAGAISVGSVTPGTAVPGPGTANATFTGFTSGFFSENMQSYFTSATVTADVNWTNRSIAFRTENTFIGNLLTGGAPIAASDLNLMGTLTYNAGSNQFTSSTPLTAPRTSLSGSATGRFYGPTAQEMGGVYSLTGDGGPGVGPTHLIGAFGARRP